MIHDRYTSILLLKTHRLGYFSYDQQGRKQAWETTVPKLLMELLLLLLPGFCPAPLLLLPLCGLAAHRDRSWRESTPYPQSFLLSEVFILLTLKSLICKNSSMIDLHFLSISSSDSEGFSCTGAGGASGLAGGNTTKRNVWKRKISILELTF